MALDPLAGNAFRVRRALESFSSLLDVLPEMTEGDIIAALQLEAATRRRRSIINRLVSRAAAIAAAQRVELIRREILRAQPEHPARKKDRGRKEK